MEEETQIKTYFKEIVLRIQIALAIAVIRITPPGITAKEHARSIQAVYKLKSLDTGHNDSLGKHEQEVLHLQQKQLLSKLWRVTQKDILQQRRSNSDSFSTAAECSPGDGGWTSESQESDTEDTYEHSIEPDLQFIHAIAHLTSVINSFAYIPMDKYQKILSSASDHAFIEPDTKSTEDMISASAGQDEKRCISSDMVKYIMHSSNGRRVLSHSVQCVLQYLGKGINVENEAEVEKVALKWRDSLLEYAVKVILSLLKCATEEDEEQNQYHQMCLDFIQNIVNAMLGSNAFYKNQMWEQICAVLLEVGKNKQICFRMISFLIERIKCMSENLKGKESISAEYPRSLDIEKSFYLFYLLEHFIKNWKSFHNSEQSMTNRNKTISKGNNSSVNITDLWRRKWLDSTKVKQEKINSNEEKDIISKWKDVLQDCMMSCKEQYPLIMTYLWECSLLLESVDKEL